MNTWMLLIYKVPNEPSARRVYVWRKLKAMGAILIQDSAWALPATPRTRERMQWLATEIRDMEGGMASLWEAQEVFTGQSAGLVQMFTAAVDAVYEDMLAKLQDPDADLAALSKLYQQTVAQDYFQSEMGQQVRQALLRRRGGDEL